MIDLTNIIVTGYDKEEGSEEEVYIQSLDRSGKQVAGSKYTWIDIDDDGDIYYGWLNMKGDFIEAGDATFAPGEAVWVYSPNDSYALQYSGSVDQEGTASVLREGFKLAANPTPVPVDLTDIVVGGYDKEEGSEEEVYIQSLDKSGKQVAGSKYTWIDVDDDGDIYYGWLNMKGDFIEEGDKVLAPGEAVWVFSPNANYTIEFPGVEIK